MLQCNFDLIDHLGRVAKVDDYQGHFQLIFFGFTHCKVVCPRALAKLSTVLDLLGELAEEIVPLYITVDPARDNPERLRSYLSPYPRFIGLTGSRERIDEAKKAFRVYAEVQPDSDEPDGYVVPHTAITYLLSREGEYMAHFPEHLDSATLATRISKILA